jgi:hypothetical protein
MCRATELASNASRAANCLFRRLGKFDGDEVFFWIKIVLAGLINHANLTELCRRFIGDHLVEFPQLERSGIVLSSSHRQQISAQFASLNFHHMLELTL